MLHDESLKMSANFQVPNYSVQHNRYLLTFELFACFALSTNIYCTSKFKYQIKKQLKASSLTSKAIYI